LLLGSEIADAGIASGAQILSTDYSFDWKAEGLDLVLNFGP